MSDYCVYIHTNKINEKRYVGITCQSTSRRWRNGDGYIQNEHFYRAIQKYGWVLRPKVVGGHVSFSQWQYVKGYYTVWGKYKAKEPIYKYYFTNDESLTSAKIKKAK